MLAKIVVDCISYLFSSMHLDMIIQNDLTMKLAWVLSRLLNIEFKTRISLRQRIWTLVSRWVREFVRAKAK